MKYLIVALIVGEVLGNIKEKSTIKNNRIRDIDHFRIYAEKTIPYIFDFSAIFWFVLALLASGTETPGQKYMWVCFALWGLASMIVGIMVRKIIIIDGEEIIIKKILLPSKRYKFSDISKVVYGDEGLIAYSENKLLFRCDKDLIGFEKLHSKLEKEKVEITSIGGKTLTKKRFFFNGTILVLIGLTFFMCFCFIIGLTLEDFSVNKFIEDTLGCVFISVFPMAIVYLIYVPRTYFYIRRIEKAINVDFDKEMKKLNVEFPNYMDKDWLIINESLYAIVLHRKLLKSIEGTKNSSDYKTKTISIKTIEDKIMKISLSPTDAKRFKDWFEKKIEL